MLHKHLLELEQSLLAVYHIPNEKPGLHPVTCLMEVNSSNPHLPRSLPNPDFLTPPTKVKEKNVTLFEMHQSYAEMNYSPHGA